MRYIAGCVCVLLVSGLSLSCTSVPDSARGPADEGTALTGGVPETDDQRVLNALGQVLATMKS